MTRPSKRELERKLQAIDDGGLSGPSPQTPEIKERRSDAVVSFVYRVCRDLFRLSQRHADGIVNESDDVVATERFLEVVRDEYGIDPDADRDQRVIETLVKSVKGDRHARPVDTFEIAPIRVATHVDVHAEDGSELAELLEDGREDEAERALIRETYALVAGDGGEPVEAAA